MTNEIFNNLHHTAFAFRGYNITNIGRTLEFLNHPAYAQIMQKHLDRVSEICADHLKRPIDLVQLIRSGAKETLEVYAESIGIVVAAELAQLEILEQFHGVKYCDVDFAFGYSLGEVTATIASGVFSDFDALHPPIAMASDCAKLAKDVRMGILFSRETILTEKKVSRLCMEITARGKGTIGVSTILSPNSALLLGQGNTIEEFEKEMESHFDGRLHMRINLNHWPPLHTPIVRQMNITDRSSIILANAQSGFIEPSPRILSLVTGDFSYTDQSARRLLRTWIDHPQRLWKGVRKALECGVETIIHVGPEPNVIPATFRRLSLNVKQQMSTSLGLRAVSELAKQRWLTGVLPHRSILLRAPSIKHVILENWLLETDPTG